MKEQERQEQALMGQERKEQQRIEEQWLIQYGYMCPELEGTGAFARVYRAWDEKRCRMVACKIGENENVWRREVEALRRIAHPLFATCYDSFCRDNRQVIVMEYVSGTTLSTLLARRGILCERVAHRIVLELAEGLRYLHESPEPLIYRDVKPENIIIREDGAVKLIDLGCVGSPGSKSVAGSRGFAAPEQLLGKDPIGFYSDVYGVGKVLQKMLGEDAKSALADVAEACVRSCAEERIPDMRFLLGELSDVKQGKKWRKNLLKDYSCAKNIHIYSA